MNSQNTIFRLNKFYALLIYIACAATFSLQAYANDATRSVRLSRDESIAIAAKSLSKKLQTDLVLKDVSVKFNKAEQYFISATQVGLRGEGTCRLDGEANELPINFDVKIDAVRQNAAEIRYVFLNMEGTTAGVASALTTEDIVTEKLLQRLKNDFKTENIVLAIDQLKEQTLDNGETGFSGAGEVRLNGMFWKKIDFEVKSADAENRDFTISKYQIK